MSRVFRLYGQLCATHPWEVIVVIMTLTTCLLTMESQHKVEEQDVLKGSQNCPGCFEEQFKAVDVVLMTIIRCLAILYTSHQFRNLQKLGSKYILGLAGLFTVISSFVFTSTVLNFLQIDFVDLKDAMFFFLLLIDLSKASTLAQFALTASSQEEISLKIAREFLVEAQYLSVDPYMRAYAISYKIGQVMIGGQVAKVIDSKNPKFPIGTVVVANLGWRTHTVLSDDKDPAKRLYILPDIGDLPVSLGLGVLGMPGNTAYFGFLDICKPKSGETVVVTGAAGAVGSHVGQIAKIKGCKVIGLTGSEDKVEWLKSLGFDHVINYKTTSDLKEALKAAAPNGIDCYFDNVGGETSSTIISLMNTLGRISVCGSISAYNATERPKATILQPLMVGKCLEMKGFLVYQYMNRWFEGIEKNLEWIKEGKLKYKETITEGFENTLQALVGVLKGDNIGKAVVSVSPTNVEHRSVDFKKLLNAFQKQTK